MKVLFRDIRAGDVTSVRNRLDKQPNLLAATATSPPKKDDGQSPLQVAIKSGPSNAYAMANLLLDYGADVNFQEISEVNSWTAPVLHDSIINAVLSSRGYGLRRHDDALADAAFALLARLLDLGADVHATDSTGTDAMGRFARCAAQVWTPSLIDEDLLQPDLRRTADLLLAHGAHPNRVLRSYGMTTLEMFAGKPLAEFLVPARSESEDRPAGARLAAT